MAVGQHGVEPIEYGEVVGRDFFDKLLLAIIDAYPEESTSPATTIRRRVERLWQAKQALLAQDRSEGRPMVADDAVLRWMGSEHYRDLAQRNALGRAGTQTHKIRSDRQLAGLAVQRFALPDNVTERFRKKFGRQRQKWLDIARYHDDVPEQLDHNLLEQIQLILAKREIRMNLSRVER